MIADICGFEGFTAIYWLLRKSTEMDKIILNFEINYLRDDKTLSF